MTAARRRSRSISLLLIGGFSAVALLGISLTAVRASAAFQEIAETGRPGYLKLGAHSATPLHAALAPGESMRWLIEASLVDAERSTLAIELDASGELLDVSAMTAQVAACTGSFELETPAGAAQGSAPDPDPAFDPEPSRVPCSGERTTVLPPTPLSQLAQRGDRFELAELRRGEPRQLLVQLSIPEGVDAAVLADRVARIGLGVHAGGETAERPVRSVEPATPRIPVTGADSLALGVLAAGLAGLGAALALRGRRRRTHGSQEGS